MITVPPWTTMNINDRIDWYWSTQVAGGSANGSVTVTATTSGKAIEIPVARSVIDADAAANAFVTVRYTLTRVGDPTPQDSAWTQFSVVGTSQTKLPAPLVDQSNGGTLDPDTLPPAGATVRVKPYAGMADGDSVMVYFGRGTGGGEYSQKFDVTRDTVGQDITMSVPKAKVQFFLNSQVVVNYVVTRFADQKTVDSNDLVLLVQGQAKWPAPGVDEAQGDYLDIDAFPNGVTTRVYSSTDMQRNDVIDLSWGNPGDAGYFDDSINVSTQRDYRFRLTQDEVLPWKGRIANISYTVTRGAQVFKSNVLMLRVGATVQQQLPMPSILEATAGVLNPDTLSAGQATAEVPVYSGMASGDQIHLVWGGGPGSGGLEWYIDVSSAMVSANKPIQRPIPLANITPFLNKTATLVYTVDDGSPVLRTSPELDVRVERQSSELLPPRVPSLNNGVLDPRTVSDAGVVVIVTYVTGMLQGDTVRLHWDNTIAAGTDQSDRIVGSQPIDIQFSVPRDKIYAGINGTVDVWYEWLRSGVRQGASTGLDFAIKLPALPPATIDQAVGTVRIDSSAAFQQGDQIELRWTGLPGAGSGTFLYTAKAGDIGNDVTITVDKAIVVADIGQTVTLDYTLMRAAGGQDEISPPPSTTCGAKSAAATCW